jgi:hypothetical protein
MRSLAPDTATHKQSAIAPSVVPHHKSTLAHVNVRVPLRSDLAPLYGDDLISLVMAAARAARGAPCNYEDQVRRMGATLMPLPLRTVRTLKLSRDVAAHAPALARVASPCEGHVLHDCRSDQPHGRRAAQVRVRQPQGAPCCTSSPCKRCRARLTRARWTNTCARAA